MGLVEDKDMGSKERVKTFPVLFRDHELLEATHFLAAFRCRQTRWTAGRRY